MPTPATALGAVSCQPTYSHHFAIPPHSSQPCPGGQLAPTSSDAPSQLQHPQMDPSPGLLNHSYPFPHNEYSTAPPCVCYPSHTASGSAQNSLVASLGEVVSESSSNTFFASHKAHCSFPGAVEKFDRNPSDTSTDQPFQPSHWMHWSNHPNDFDTSNNFHHEQVLDGQASVDSASKTEGNLAPSEAYPTGSFHLLDLPQPCEPDPSIDHSNPSNSLHGRISSQLGSNRFDLPSNGSAFQNELQSVLNDDKPPSIPSDPRAVRSTFACHRNKDGLPSNSHHLLNSPELKTTQINRFSQEDATYFCDSGKDQAGLVSESEPHSHTDKLTQSTTQPHRPTRSSARLASTTPQKGKACSILQGGNDPIDTTEHPPSEDAASILLELSRHEPPKHGMLLRRGRGGAGSRPDPPKTGSCDEKPSAPLTPSGRKYRTRSQMQEEALLKEQSPNNRADPLPTRGENLDNQPAQQSFNNCKNGSSIVPLDLGYGLPAGHNQGLISVSGSTSASTCTSRSNTGDRSSLNMTPGLDSNLTLHNLISKPHVNFPGRLHLKLPGCSPALSMAHSSAPNSIVARGAAFMDDDAKSSFSISTQATSLISPPGYFTRRTFPPEVPIDLHFPRLYRTFFVSSAFGDREPIKSQAESYKIPIMKTPPNSNYNSPAHGYLDLYTPRYVKGVGAEKLGLCCICAEPKERGGEDTALWLKMKVSSYSYHLSFFHGINNADGLPFSPPVEIRLVKRSHVAANEKLELKEGRCHHCNKWVPMEGVKMQEVKVPELFWWKHAKSCHKSRLPGECHVHIPDEVYDLVTRQQPTGGSLYNGSCGGSLPASSCSTPYSYYNSGELPTSNSPYASRYPASPAPTCSSVSQSGGSRVHPSVAAQRASAGRVYKRKASNSNLGRKRRDSSIAADQSHSPQSSIWPPLSLSVGMNPSTGGSTTSMHSHQHLIQHPQSPTPVQLNHPAPTGRKTRRSNMLE